MLGKYSTQRHLEGDPNYRQILKINLREDKDQNQ